MAYRGAKQRPGGRQGIRPDATGKYHNSSDLLFNIRTEAWFFRNYPEGNLASEIIGYSRQEGSGQGRSEDGVIRFYREIGDWGVERFYNDILQGAREDVSWTVVPVEITSNLDRAQPPADLVLTIDREIQAETEAALREGVLAGEATRGSIIVLNPHTGEILAMADYPSVDLQNPDGFLDTFKAKGRQPMDPEGQVVSLNVAAPYEPGSTFKVLTMAAALDSGAVTPDTWFMDSGRIEIGGVVIHNWQQRGFGLQDMTGCLRHSINTCLAWVATQLGPGPFYEYMDRFRIGRLTGVDMSPEISGILRRPGDQDPGPIPPWPPTPTDRVFPPRTLQMAVAISAVANGGVMMTPHVVRQIILPDGRVHTVTPVPLGQPISRRDGRDPPGNAGGLARAGRFESIGGGLPHRRENRDGRHSSVRDHQDRGFVRRLGTGRRSAGSDLHPDRRTDLGRGPAVRIDHRRAGVCPAGAADLCTAWYSAGLGPAVTFDGRVTGKIHAYLGRGF